MPIRVHFDNPAYSAVVTLLTPAGAVKLGLGLFQRLEQCLLVLDEKINRPIQIRTYCHGVTPTFAFDDDAWIARSSVWVPRQIGDELSHGYLQSGVCAVRRSVPPTNDGLKCKLPLPLHIVTTDSDANCHMGMRKIATYCDHRATN